jgi:hypothetical protein
LKVFRGPAGIQATETLARPAVLKRSSADGFIPEEPGSEVIMRNQVDHHDAELLLRLYELRREEKLRQARDWYAREFKAESIEDFYRKFPRGTQENDFFRMVVSYWDMAASIVNKGLINEEFFFENTAEFYVAWMKVKPLVASWREKRKNPNLWKNLEELAERYEQWSAQRAPEALEVFRHLFLGEPSK